MLILGEEWCWERGLLLLGLEGIAIELKGEGEEGVEGVDGVLLLVVVRPKWALALRIRV